MCNLTQFVRFEFHRDGYFNRAHSAFLVQINETDE